MRLTIEAIVTVLPDDRSTRFMIESMNGPATCVTFGAEPIAVVSVARSSSGVTKRPAMPPTTTAAGAIDSATKNARPPAEREPRCAANRREITRQYATSLPIRPRIQTSSHSAGAGLEHTLIA